MRSGKKRRGEHVSHEVAYQTERLDHLGIVAGVCQEAGIAEWLDKQAGDSRRGVSVGKATVAMVLNGLGFSNRQLYLVPQYFENKPVEHLLGAGFSADMRERSTVWGAPWIGSMSMM
jgi:transposase